VFDGFPLIFLLGILIFKGLTARRLYKSFGIKGLIMQGAEQNMQNISGLENVKLQRTGETDIGFVP
jgi:hypothetical protein